MSTALFKLSVPALIVTAPSKLLLELAVAPRYRLSYPVKSTAAVLFAVMAMTPEDLAAILPLPSQAPTVA